MVDMKKSEVCMHATMQLLLLNKDQQNVSKSLARIKAISTPKELGNSFRTQTDYQG
jgi:hypothetical protein